MHLPILVAAMASLVLVNGQEKAGNCLRSCGNVTIEFPFGTREGCYYDRNFLVTCSHSILFYGNVTVTNIRISKGEMEIMMFVAYDCYNRAGPYTKNNPFLDLGNFRISTKNRFVSIGCDTHGYLKASRGNGSAGTGCISTCDSSDYIADGSCSGIGCCKIAIPQGLRTFSIRLTSYNNHSNILGFNPCSYGFVIEEDKFNFSSSYLGGYQTSDPKKPMLLDWAIGDVTCDRASKNESSFLCKGNSTCDQDYHGPGYRCACKDGYEGNPYVANGCKNIDECELKIHDCQHECIDTEGSYDCRCPEGSSGDGKKNGTGCTADQTRVVKIAVGTSTAVAFLLICGIWLYLGLMKRKHMMLRDKYFRENGGLMLKQSIAMDERSRDTAKIFTEKDLKRATNNYDESRIIGKGGYGIVYKGFLDNRAVAIKKSKQVEPTQIEQFINEVIILSQINHRNVVKLIGCCLETQVPLLVYEFIPNGTLSDHIHHESKRSAITWDIRLTIATETAGALSYLHSDTSVPVIHRDIKSVNILLDHSYVAKVADFGASRLIPTDQMELATMMQGTIGYLDPEYLQTSQLTDKSDVYSFGVVLVELLTGKKANSPDRPEEERNLAKYFLLSMKQGKLFEVLDEHLRLNELSNQIIEVSKLAESCLSIKGDKRPTMKEVAKKLEGILASVIHRHPWVQSTSNEEETEVLDDHGFTDGTNTSTVTFDSISKHTILPIASGR